MGKEWDLPRGKLAHCPDLKVQGVSTTKSLSELLILILKGIFSAVFFWVGKPQTSKNFTLTLGYLNKSKLHLFIRTERVPAAKTARSSCFSGKFLEF